MYVQTHATVYTTSACISTHILQPDIAHQGPTGTVCTFKRCFFCYRVDAKDAELQVSELLVQADKRDHPVEYGRLAVEVKKHGGVRNPWWGATLQYPSAPESALHVFRVGACS